MIKHHFWWPCCSTCGRVEMRNTSLLQHLIQITLLLSDLMTWNLNKSCLSRENKWVIGMMILCKIHQPYHIIPYSGLTTLFYIIIWKGKKEVHLKSYCYETYTVDWLKWVEILCESVWLKELSCFKFKCTDPDREQQVLDYTNQWKHNKSTDKWMTVIISLEGLPFIWTLTGITHPKVTEGQVHTEKHLCVTSSCLDSLDLFWWQYQAGDFK